MRGHAGVIVGLLLAAMSCALIWYVPERTPSSEPSARLVSTVEAPAQDVANGYAELVRRHYLPYAPPVWKRMGAEFEWIAALILIGGYQGTFEPCGCSAGQSGGHAWEATLRNEIQKSLGSREPMRVLSVGDDLSGTAVGPGGVFEERFRALNGEYVHEFFSATGVDNWVVSSAEDGFVNSPGVGLGIVRPGEFVNLDLAACVIQVVSCADGPPGIRARRSRVSAVRPSASGFQAQSRRRRRAAESVEPWGKVAARPSTSSLT